MMKTIQQSLLEFIDTDLNEEYELNQLVTILEQYQINTSRIELCSLLHILVQPSNNHFRYPSFFTKIDKILLYFKSSIQQFFTESEIFNISRTNKRLLLFLFEQNILKPDQKIANIFLSRQYYYQNYPQYFYPEFESFFPKENFFEQEETSISIESQKETENDGPLETKIRRDEIEKFIPFVHQNKIQLNSKINPSIYETNSLLLKKTPTLIDIAAFHGSIRIFQYLIGQKVDIKSKIWIYAIYGKNPEII